MSFLENYEDVATRIQRFWATYPDGKIHTSIIDIDIKAGYILIECRVYKEFNDHEPSGIDFAFGNVATYNVQMKKWFVEDTVTSAIGRAVGLVLGADKRPTAQNMAHVDRVDSAIIVSSANDVDLWATNSSTSLKLAIDEIEPQLGGQLIPVAPMCSHGHMVWRSGDKNGRAWAGYMCVEKVQARQCAPNWFTLTSDGQWKPK